MLQRPKGTKDIYGKEQQIYETIFTTFKAIAKTFNLEQITTPTFENANLFNCAGNQSDVVTKELYRFNDRAGRALALKPEGSAPVARALVENKLLNDPKYQKLYYIDAMFRYEKPQKGRLRQFYQIGVELINDLSIYTTIEAIMLARMFLKQLGINDYRLEINSLGSIQERNQYEQALKTYFKKHQKQLSIQSQARIDTNPLRILDDKIDCHLDVVKNAPQIEMFWSSQTKNEFKQLLALLDLINLKYHVNYRLVRGLDYYSNVVFEFTSNHQNLGAKTTLIGGGTYYGLNNNPHINGIGWGCGVERLLAILLDQNQIIKSTNKTIVFLVESQSQYRPILPIIYHLRQLNYQVDFNYQIKSFKKLYRSIIKTQPQLIIFQNPDQIGFKQWNIKKQSDDFKQVDTCDIDDLVKMVIKMLPS